MGNKAIGISDLPDFAIHSVNLDRYPDGIETLIRLSDEEAYAGIHYFAVDNREKQLPPGEFMGKLEATLALRGAYMSGISFPSDDKYGDFESNPRHQLFLFVYKLSGTRTPVCGTENFGPVLLGGREVPTFNAGAGISMDLFNVVQLGFDDSELAKINYAWRDFREKREAQGRTYSSEPHSFTYPVEEMARKVLKCVYDKGSQHKDVCLIT